MQVERLATDQEVRGSPRRWRGMSHRWPRLWRDRKREALPGAGVRSFPAPDYGLFVTLTQSTITLPKFALIDWTVDSGMP